MESGTLKISGEFEKGKYIQAFLLGPNKTFDALEAKIKLSSATEVVQRFGISVCLWNDGIFDYSARISFHKSYPDDPLTINGDIRKTPGENNFYFVPIPKGYPPLEQLLSPGTLCGNASVDTWYRVRIAFDGKQVLFYLKEGEGELKEGDKVKVTIMFRGREMAHPEFGREILERVVVATKDLCQEQPDVSTVRIEGRNMTLTLSPGK